LPLTAQLLASTAKKPKYKIIICHIMRKSSKENNTSLLKKYELGIHFLKISMAKPLPVSTTNNHEANHWQH
jgi:hypothetical protein